MSQREGQRLNREQLIELVRKIMLAEADEKEMDHMVRTFEANVPHPDGSDLIFWPTGVPHDPTQPEPTPEEIVDMALSYEKSAVKRRFRETVVAVVEMDSGRAAGGGRLVYGDEKMGQSADMVELPRLARFPSERRYSSGIARTCPR